MCILCQATGCPWDQIAGKPVCTDCQELLICGDLSPWNLEPQSSRCALCETSATIPFLTYPLCDPDPVEIDLCGSHLVALLGRRLSARAYRRLRRRLNKLGFAVEQFFLLHEAFYDEEGRALQPLSDF